MRIIHQNGKDTIDLNLDNGNFENEAILSISILSRRRIQAMQNKWWFLVYGLTFILKEIYLSL